jgi:hypothetical protein
MSDTNVELFDVERIEVEQLEQHVQCRLAGRVRELRLLRQADGLILRGRAPSYHVKQLAQHALMQVTPLRILANEIQVC